MKTPRLFQVVPAALAMSLILAEANWAQTPPLKINPNFQPDPLILNGQSGGTVKSNCGNLANVPNQVIEVTESLPYLRLTVESKGQPTLLIDGPGGRFCVMADNYSKSNPELSGYWQAGKYLLFVGELSPQQHSYTLSISKQKQ
ncbi:MAG: hypothetical protein KME21_11815 [Desmonostoc vinosum HA7617-LM4]|jgi:hypothetical protein|nr:hypothetical protein [Desmonostoc vinosum HA7617-LM4]